MSANERLTWRITTATCLRQLSWRSFFLHQVTMVHFYYTIVRNAVKQACIFGDTPSDTKRLYAWPSHFSLCLSYPEDFSLINNFEVFRHSIEIIQLTKNWVDMTWGCVGLVHYIVQHASKKFRGFYFSRKTSTWKNEKIRKQQEKIETDSKNPVEASEDSATTCLLFVFRYINN